MTRPAADGLMHRFADALAPGEPFAVMRPVIWAMIGAGGLIAFKLTAPLCAAAAMLLGAQ